MAAGGEAALPPGVVGTPGYLSPEAARGEAPQPVNDVFSAGLVLAEMLMGKPLVAETDPYRAIYRVAHEDLLLPTDPAHPVDDNLRAWVHRALARDPACALPAVNMAEALNTGSAPPATARCRCLEAPTNATLEFLLRRVRDTGISRHVGTNLQ
jgi:serine/threonine protein kinase